jgi:glycerophosphoryl diester phosphodiesterase
VVSSFWPATVAAVRAAAPDVPVGLLTHPLLGPDAAVDAAAGLACAAVHLHHSQVSASSVDRAHGLDMAVVTWTVNLDADVHAVVRADVDVVITDRVATVRAALGRG